jgi:cell volume regulation protein A
MVGYPVIEDSAVANGAPVPRWARPAFVVRDQAIVMPADAGRLRVGDHAYFLAPPRRAEQLDALFAARVELVTTNEPFFGEFDFGGSVKLREMAGFYNLTIEPDIADMTIAGLFADRFENAPEVGDHLPLGTATLIVRDAVDGQVTRAGLQVATAVEDPVKTALDTGLGRLKKFAARLMP